MIHNPDNSRTKDRWFFQSFVSKGPTNTGENPARRGQKGETQSMLWLTWCLFSMVTINKLFPFFSTCMSTWIRDSFCFTQVMATRRGQLCRLYPATYHIAIPGNDVVGHIITTAWVLSDSCGHFCLEFNHQTIKISFKIFRNGHRFPDVCNAVVVESSRVPLRILAHFNGIPANSPTHRGAIGFMQKGILWTSRL